MRERSNWLFGRLLVTGALMAAGLGGSGCASLVGEQNADATITMHGPGGLFDYDTQTVLVDADVHSANRVTLLNLSLESKSTRDLTFIESVRAEIVAPGQTALVATHGAFPKGEPIVNIPVQYKDDLIPFFPDGQTITVHWTGSTSKTFAYPPAGADVVVHVTINVE
jgi:hypothetical protein